MLIIQLNSLSESVLDKGSYFLFVCTSRSSEHGKGLNRFWSSVEGYLGQLLLLISATSENASGGRWVIGVLTQQGFENRDSFYGSSGYLYAISPSFHIYSPSGMQENSFFFIGTLGLANHSSVSGQGRTRTLYIVTHTLLGKYMKHIRSLWVLGLEE